MTSGKRIGLREVRALTPGTAIWDSGVAGFGARRQRDSVAYILKYHRRTGGNGGTPLGGTGAVDARRSARRSSEGAR